MKPWILFKERPILFSGNMVRAILDGNKTQTRRIVKEKEIRNRFPMYIKNNIWAWGTKPCDGTQACWSHDTFKCPYGTEGDRLWVRETWSYLDSEKTEFIYRADDNRWIEDLHSAGSPWKPSIHMPREASRITLEIKNIRVERLQDISEEDSKAEGIEWIINSENAWGWRDYATRNSITYVCTESFKSLWESIHGSESLKQNPWVWVIEFEKK